MVPNRLLAPKEAALQGAAKVKVFEDKEYLGRNNNARAEMQKRGIDVLLVINEANMSYLTGYRGLSSYTPQMVVLSLDDEIPRIIVRQQDEPVARHNVFMNSDRIFPYSEDYIATREKSAYDYIATLLEQWGFGKKRLGIELDNSPLTPSAWERFKKNLPNARFQDATNLVAWLRTYKSSQEITYMRQGGKIGDLAIQAALDSIGVGVRECEVAARVMAAQCAGTPEFAGDRPKSPAMPSGEISSCPHLSWRDRSYGPNETVNFELGGWRYRYATAVSRSIHLGKPSDQLKSLHAATAEGLAAIFALAKPGRTCSELEAKFRSTTQKEGWAKNSRVGYSIGIDWLESTACIVPWDHTVLRPNMTFHLMLGMWQDTWGYVLSETMRVTETGSESFSSLPRELFIR